MEYTISQVAQKTNLSAHVLRYYEKEGLLPHVGRSESGIRRYADDDLEWLGLICCLKSTGMSIKQIRAFVDLSAQGDATLGQRCEMLAAHKKEVQVQIRQMHRHLEKVTCKIAHFGAQYQRYLEARVSSATGAAQDTACAR
ncbi:MAG: MerR family transcriptional regulator [Oscillospiraceae bacterium]|nr:MerR family transcriptional regulator [Oscillospiraceae bacterium]